MVKLGKILKQNTNTEIVEPDKPYRLLGVRLEGKGPFIREEKLGSQIRAKKLQRVNSGDFIYSRLFAWRGAFGSIPVDMDGAYVSNEFPNFKMDENEVYLKFLELYFRQRWVWNEIEKQCTGTTKASRNRFKEKYFLDFEIPLPSLEEQKRIVVRIEEIMSRVEQAKKIREETLRDAEKIMQSALHQIFSKAQEKGWKWAKLEDVAVVSMGQSPPGRSYNQDGIGVPLINGPTEFGFNHPTPVQWTTEPTRMCKEADILICVRGATTGRMNWADQEYCLGRGIAAISPLLTIIPSFLYFFVQTQTSEILNRSSGSTFPNLGKSDLKSLSIPLPSLEEQKNIVSYLDEVQNKIETLKKLQEKTNKQIETLTQAVLKKVYSGKL